MSDDEKNSQEGENPEEEEEKEEPEPDVPLPELNVEIEEKKVFDLAKECLSKIGKTQDGTGYAFTELDISKKKIKNLYQAMLKFPHLRLIDCSFNQIPDLQTLTETHQLLILHAANNKVKSMNFLCMSDERLSLLREVDLSNNLITELPAVNCLKLRKLILNGNQITTCKEFKGHGALETLQMRKNKLTNCEGLGKMPILQRLDLSENEITDISGLNDLPALKNLNLKENKVEAIERPFPELPRLHTLNFEKNAVLDGKQFNALADIPSLKHFYCLENPLFEEGGDGLKKDLMKAFLPHPEADDLAENSKKPVPRMIPEITMFNEDEIGPEDIEEVWNEKKEDEQKRLEEEEQRRLDEEEERKRKEEEEAEAEAERLRQLEENGGEQPAADGEGEEGEGEGDGEEDE